MSQMMLAGIPHGLFMLMGGTLILWDEFNRVFSSNLDSPRFLKKYRELQVLEKLNNSCLRFNTFSKMAFACPIVEIFSGFAIVKLHHSMDIFYLVALLVAKFVAALVNLVVFGAGSIYSQSWKWLQTEQNLRKGNKFERRVIKSMMPLRIWFGSNYVDPLTPLVVQHFCISQTMNLLLLAYFA